MIVDKSNISIDVFHNAPVVITGADDRVNHMKHVLRQEMIDGRIAEFGVFKGKTLRLISEAFPNEPVFGFDSFVGLPEAWFMTTEERKNESPRCLEGHFDMTNMRLNFRDNVHLVKGFFNESLPKWIKSVKPNQMKLIHIDSDLYSSAVDVFENLNPYIVEGTIIVFDEMYPWADYSNYDLWEEGEWRALVEWVKKYDTAFEVVSRNNRMQCAIRVV